ncbi:hypothetical protein LJR231_001027 [Phyllobacterium sp. LjRoot231]|uniref:hypothetical protein n=1 Tax=Phyllobacterium sp. LjRoot231 TaxID=3342289 RepID=UPI003ECCB946
MRVWFIVTTFLLLVASPAGAQNKIQTQTTDGFLKSIGMAEPAPQRFVQSNAALPCFAVSRGPADSMVFLVNQCNGQTWMLIRMPIEKTPGEFQYVWRPVYPTKEP